MKARAARWPRTRRTRTRRRRRQFHTSRSPRQFAGVPVARTAKFASTTSPTAKVSPTEDGAAFDGGGGEPASAARSSAAPVVRRPRDGGRCCVRPTSRPTASRRPLGSSSSSSLSKEAVLSKDCVGDGSQSLPGACARACSRLPPPCGPPRPPGPRRQVGLVGFFELGEAHVLDRVDRLLPQPSCSS